MLQALEYPFDVATILRKRKALKELLLHRETQEVRVAILGGATSSELMQLLELFLLSAGLRAVFYESDYNRYYEEVMLDSSGLRAFSPQFVLLYTSSRNVSCWPSLTDGEPRVTSLLDTEVARFSGMWDRLAAEHSCYVLQTNFEAFPQRASGHLHASAPGGRQRFIGRLNDRLAQAVSERKGVMLLDQSHLAAQLGLGAWHGSEHWYGYKLATTPAGTIATAHAAARTIAGALGKARKCLVLDLDNTLWGGVIGDDGVSGLKLGRDSAIGEAYLDFQAYCLELKARGVLLAVASKNDPARAREGFQHPDSLLKLEDFSAFVASWSPKDGSLRTIAEQLNIGLDSLVFVDDNPAERALVREQLPQVKVPEIGSNVTEFASIIEHNLYFERPELSSEDLARASYYAENRQREAAQAAHASYEEYLVSLGMRAEVGSFSGTYIERVTQLVNKTNQFNLTTRRYTLPEVTRLAESTDHLTLWGRLIDRFGDNGLVSVLLGECRGTELHIDLWLMSCRVLKRGFEQAMLDVLVERARRRGLRRLVGYYLRTAKNEMVADHYGQLGFSLLERDPAGAKSVWQLELEPAYVPRNTVIKEVVVHE